MNQGTARKLAFTGDFSPELNSAGHAQRNTDDDRVDGCILMPTQTSATGIIVNDGLDQSALAEAREFFRPAHDQREFFRYRITFPQDTRTVVVTEPEVPDGASGGVAPDGDRFEGKRGNEGKKSLFSRFIDKVSSVCQSPRLSHHSARPTPSR